ncbi:MAG: carboxypeptidase regulatory-like domain-containing protein [Planctomycetota bacterium]
MVRLAVGVALLVVAACQQEPREWSRPYEGYLPYTEWNRFAVLVVRDRRTGRPIPGATVAAHPENDLGPDGWAPERARTTTDEFGLAWIPRLEDYGDIHWAVDAEGYAPTEEYGVGVSEIVDLEPGEDRFGRILDAFGNPMAGVRVEYKVGCAHSPGLRRTTTDKEGRFTLRCIGDSGDVPLERGGLHAEYWRARDLSLKGERLAEFHSLPGRTVVGRILDPHGNPLAGAPLAASGRGPSTATGPDGRFTLSGTGREPMVYVWHDEFGYVEFNLGDYRRDGPVVLQIGQKTLEPEHVAVDVEMPQNDVSVHLVREADGRRYAARSDDGAARIKAPPGIYLLRAGAPDERYVAAGRQVEVVREGQRFALEVEEQPTLHCVVDDLPEDADSWLIHGGYCFDEDVHLARRDYYLPPNVEAKVVTEAWGRRKVFSVEAAAGGVRRVVLDWEKDRPRQVRFKTVPGSVVGYRILGEQAFPREDEGQGDVIDSDDKDALILETWATGRRTLRYLLDSGATRDVAIDLPAEAGGVLRIEKPDLPPAAPRRAITVLNADGSPARLRECTLFPEQPWVYDPDDGTGVPGAHYRITGARPEGGFCAARYGRLEGAGPWTVELGGAALRVAIAVEDGECEDCAVYVDGEVFQVERGVVTSVVGLRAGAHTVIAGAEGHVGRVMRVVLEEGETREVRVSLGRRQ